MAQLDDVYSDLRLNYETLKGLISLASLSVAKPTHYETLMRVRNTSPEKCSNPVLLRFTLSRPRRLNELTSAA